ncbi:hypothetical protein RJ640_022318 [Escallonia rubra]|uniref:UBN2 domain-containing protein n=1 Tax=Escallonia rubra TaxID=112253 RepID=A0AA88U9U3_9ASTE|nr:hypothetical protein RJ640_022318 [Escallonia rubra]
MAFFDSVSDPTEALRVDASADLTAESSTEQKAAYEKWERSNRISLMIMKGSITTAIPRAIPDSDNAKMYLAHIEEQFQSSSKAHATTLITKMVTLKYSGSNGVCEHILRMNDMASQLKGFDMEISEGFLVHFIMTSLPAQFDPLKINYNTQKEKWKMSELIFICVQEEERLKSEQPDSAHVAITGPSKGKGKGKKFDKGSMQGNKSTSVTKTDKASSFGTKGVLSVKKLNKEDRNVLVGNGEKAQVEAIRTLRLVLESGFNLDSVDTVGAPLPHIEDNDAPEVVPNYVPLIMDPAPIPANEQLLRRQNKINFFEAEICSIFKHPQALVRLLLPTRLAHSLWMEDAQTMKVRYFIQGEVICGSSGESGI